MSKHQELFSLFKLLLGKEVVERNVSGNNTRRSTLVGMYLKDNMLTLTVEGCKIFDTEGNLVEEKVSDIIHCQPSTFVNATSEAGPRGYIQYLDVYIGYES